MLGYFPICLLESNEKSKRHALLCNTVCSIRNSAERWARANSWNCNSVHSHTHTCAHIWCAAYHYSVFDFAVCRATTLVEGRTMNLICHYSDECFVCVCVLISFFVRHVPSLCMLPCASIQLMISFESRRLLFTVSWYFWWFYFEWDSLNRNEMKWNVLNL